MKKISLITMVLAMALAFAVGCGKDDITDLERPGNGDVTGDGDGDGNGGAVSDTTFDLDIYVVFSQSGNATVTGGSSNFDVSVSGNGVTVVNNGRERARYHLSGSTTNGFLKIYSLRRQMIELNGVSITNPAGAAINIQGSRDSLSKGKRAIVVLNGSSSLTDGTSYTATPTGEDEKAAFFSEGPLIFQGTGSLAVTAKGKSGIVTDEYFTMQGGTITVNMTSAARVISGDTLKPACIKGKEFFTMLDGTLTLTSSGTGGKGISGDSTAVFSGGTVTVNVTGTNFGSSGGGGGFPRPGQQQRNDGVSAKGIKFDGNIVFSGSNVNVSCSSHEAIKSKGTLTISGGIVYGTSASDDAINAASDFTITGGLVGAYATGNDALDANGNMYIRGGVVYAVSTAGTPEVSLDANTEGGKRLYVEGGTLVAIGGLESGAQLTQSCYQTLSISNNTWYSITVGSDTYAFKTPASSSTGGGGGGPRPGSGSTSLVVSGSVQPTVKSGVTVNGGTNYFNNTFTVGGTVSGGSQVSLTTYSGGGGFPF